MKILFLSRWYPYPHSNGSKLRIWNILKVLGAQHSVDLMTFAEADDQIDSETLGTLERHCRRVRTVPYRRFRPSSTRAVTGFFGPLPRSLVDVHSPEMQQVVRGSLRRERYDLVIASQLDMLPYALEATDVPVILEELELTSYLDAVGAAGSPVSRLRATATWLKLRAYLRRTLPHMTACTVASDLELAHTRRAVPAYRHVHVIPNAIDLNDYPTDWQPRSDALVFAGSPTYRPNYLAVSELAEHIMPAVRQAHPSAQLTVTGQTDGVNLQRLVGRPGITMTGRVPDVRSIVGESWASVVPIRSGGGSRLKILESMALGTPVVATPKAAEGLAIRHDRDILLAESPADLARVTIELLGAADVRRRLSEAGRRLVESHYTWQTLGPQFVRLSLQSAGKAR